MALKMNRVTESRYLPRVTARPTEVQALVEMLACAVVGRTATYVAVPMTSGNRYFEWYARHGRDLARQGPEYRSSHEQEVLRPNLLHARSAMLRIRKSIPGIVLDPTLLELPGWEQRDYHVLWGTVIERYAQRVVFLDGWEFS